MSDPEPERPDLKALDRLEDVLEAALKRVDVLESRLREAEKRRHELRELLDGFGSGGEDPARLARRARRLEEENRALRRRMEEGRGVVERILARIRFLEENA